MKPNPPFEKPLLEVRQDEENTLNVILQGPADISTAPALIRQLSASVPPNQTIQQVKVDFARVTRLDDYGAMVVLRLVQILKLNHDQLSFVNLAPEHEKTLALVDFGQPDCRIPSHKSGNLIIRLGDATISVFQGGTLFVEFIGAMVFSLMRVLKRPQSFRANDAITYMKTTGVDALPVVGLISFLLGLIMAFMSSLQLSQFGANLYVASLVSLAMVSELGPIMTAIVVAGRSGSAYAAEISTMKISEEIDALVVMGFDPNLFLVLPRVVAAMVVVPILTVFAGIFAVAGGLVIGVLMLSLSPGAYIQQSLEALSLFEVMWGFSKSVVFALLIALTGCFRGLQARGGAAAVGSAATSAVVTSIFLIILFDSVFAIIRSYW
ncbi:MAG: ABC transporter permease [Desulfobacterales bacterium]|nr:ABC transporter permease [Desulfobacterales bacterium]